jgi:anti-sigma factor RsiW
MDCRDVRLHLLDYQRGRLEPELRGDVRAHLATCPACRRSEVAEEALTALLERRMPQYPASLALKRRLAARWAEPPAPRRTWWSRPRGGWPALVPALAVAAVLLVTIPLVVRRGAPPADGTAALVTEAVNDHLRVLASQHPLDIESGGIHQVRPWFEGRLDFAPEVPFEGDADFPLRGGAVGYFVDRKAAVFVYGHGRHTISLLVFRPEGLAWPARGLVPLGEVQAYETRLRGFTVYLWRTPQLGYALVADVEPTELRELAARLAGKRAPPA